MNAPQPSQRTATPSMDRPAKTGADIATPARRPHRDRDFGIGYGNSSGYASERRYLDGHVDPLFRCR